MGTNFYRVRIPTEEEKNTMHKLINENRFNELTKFVNEIIDEVHICKRSGGWYICFDHNFGKHYQPNRKSLEEFLNEPNTIIKDEYGDTYSSTEFWNMVDNWNSKDDLWDSESYDKWEKEQTPSYHSIICWEDIKKCKELFNIDTNNNDFVVDGLRFAVYTNFC